MPHLFAFDQPFGHTVDRIGRIADFIIGKNPHAFVEEAVFDPVKRLNDVPERDAEVAAYQDRQANSNPDKNYYIDTDRRLQFFKRKRRFLLISHDSVQN